MSLSTTTNLSNTLMESGSIELNQGYGAWIAVRRGMTMLTSDGQTAGHVAAVVTDGPSGKVTHVVLGHLRQIPEYRLTPIALIETVADEKVLLRIMQSVVESLPIWHEP